MTSEAGTITGALDGDEWSGEIHLKSAIKKGQTLGLVVKVKGLDLPLTLADAVEVVGPRPRITSVQRSAPGAMGVEIGADVLPGETPAGWVLNLDRTHSESRPQVELGCEGGELRHGLTLSTGTLHGGCEPKPRRVRGRCTCRWTRGAVGYAGCKLSATR